MKTLLVSDNDFIGRPFIRLDVKKALFDNEFLESPSLDGANLGFYEQY